MKSKALVLKDLEILERTQSSRDRQVFHYMMSGGWAHKLRNNNIDENNIVIDKKGDILPPSMETT